MSVGARRGWEGAGVTSAFLITMASQPEGAQVGGGCWWVGKGVGGGLGWVGMGWGGLG